MRIEGSVAVVTGAAGGIGFALARRFVHLGAKGVVLADVRQAPLEAAAAQLGALALTCDSAREQDVRALIEQAQARFGPIDLYVSNAGVFQPGTEAAPDAQWTLNWQLHVMAHVYAARVLMPKMSARGTGAFVITASAAGLLTHADSATYAVTKHAAVAFGESLSVRYGDSGVHIAVLCPQAVRTAMTQGIERDASMVDGMLEPDAVADSLVDALAQERFLVLPHPSVLEYFRRKAADYDRWLRGMRRLGARLLRKAPEKAASEKDLGGGEAR